MNEFYVQLLLITKKPKSKDTRNIHIENQLKISNRLNLILISTFIVELAINFMVVGAFVWLFIFFRSQIPVDSRQSDSESRARIYLFRQKSENFVRIFRSVWKLRFDTINEITCYLDKEASDFFLLPSEHFSFSSKQTKIIIIARSKTTLTFG